MSRNKFRCQKRKYRANTLSFINISEGFLGSEKNRLYTFVLLLKNITSIEVVPLIRQGEGDDHLNVTKN